MALIDPVGASRSDAWSFSRRKSPQDRTPARKGLQIPPLGRPLPPTSDPAREVAALYAEAREASLRSPLEGYAAYQLAIYTDHQAQGYAPDDLSGTRFDARV